MTSEFRCSPPIPTWLVQPPLRPRREVARDGRVVRQPAGHRQDAIRSGGLKMAPDNIITKRPNMPFPPKMAAATVAETALQDRQDTATSPLAPLGDDDFDDEDGIQGRDAGLGSSFLI